MPRNWEQLSTSPFCTGAPPLAAASPPLSSPPLVAASPRIFVNLHRADEASPTPPPARQLFIENVKVKVARLLTLLSRLKAPYHFYSAYIYIHTHATYATYLHWVRIKRATQREVSIKLFYRAEALYVSPATTRLVKNVWNICENMLRKQVSRQLRKSYFVVNFVSIIVNKRCIERD